MITLVWVGANPRNIGGLSAKGYTITRKGKKVVAQWGRIEVVGGAAGKYYWRSTPSDTTYAFETAQEARDFVRWQSRSKKQKGYDRLPTRVRIRRARIK